MFSVVIPLYNKEKYIASTLSSVLNQSLKDFEIIIVNDGSTDRSVEVVKEFDDSRIRLINQTNAGVSAARNRGIREAKFNWVAFLDADDMWGADFLSEISNAIDRHPQNSVFAGGKSFIINGVAHRYSNEFLPQDGETDELSLYEVLSKYGGPINPSNAVIRKKHLEKNGLFRIGQKNFEDYDLWIRLCINEPVVYVNKELLFANRDVSESASSGVFLADDFISYIQRISEVEQQLTKADLIFFKKYYKKFNLINFMNYKVYYSKEERRRIKRASRKLLKFPYNSILNFFMTIDIKFESIVKIGRFIKKRILLK